jgi:hypothetical protein
MRAVVTYAFPVWEFAADAHLLNCSAYKTKVFRTTGNFQGAHRCARCRLISKCRTFRITKRNCAVNEHRPDKTLKMKMFAISENVKPDTENKLKRLDLVAIKRTTVQVTRQPL